MDVPKTLQELCQRYGVPQSFGQRLRPLFERAQEAEPEARRRIMDLIARSFAEEANRAARERLGALPESEARILHTVAGILHPWDPPSWLSEWSEGQRG